MLLVWCYLRRATRRLDSLIIRFRAGRLRPARPRPPAPNPTAFHPGAPRAATPRPGATPPHPRLPHGAAWLGRLGWEFRGHGSQLQALLNHDPELRALLAAAPEQAGRVLRPLCWMLGIDPGPGILPPPRRRAPEPQADPPGEPDPPVLTAPPALTAQPVLPAPADETSDHRVASGPGIDPGRRAAPRQTAPPPDTA
jgi:hypothetical protein